MVKIEPATQSVAAGGAFSITVLVEDVADMAGDQATVHFDPTAFSVTRVTEGEFLKSVGTTIGAGMEKIDNENGRVTFFYALISPCSGVSGSGALATITFTTTTAAGGTFTLGLSDVLLDNATGYILPLAEIADGTISISGTGGPTPTPKGNGGGGGGGSSTLLTPTPSPTAPPTSTSPSPTSSPAISSPAATPISTATPEATTPTQTSAAPTATPTPAAAGFELLFAIAATGAVAILLRIRK